MSKILILNAGSSSLKYKIYDYIDDELKEIKHGSVGGIGFSDGPKNHKLALSLLFEGYGISAPNLGKIKNLAAIGHRVVYGGLKYSQTTIINSKVITDLKKYNDLAPLHNPPIISTMESVLVNTGKKGHRDIPSFAVFDTQFFKNLPDVTKIYPLPYHYYEDKGIQRFGFHGLSHKNVLSEVSKNHPDSGKLISIHLGSGSSITAIKDGKPIDTSMGFTPQEGLIMATRAGDIDPGIITYLMRQNGGKPKDIDNIISNQSGLLGISGVSSSMKDILYTAGLKVEDHNYEPTSKIKRLPDVYKTKAKLAIDMYIYRIKKYIGAYYAILGGVNVLAFTGEIGSGSSLIREMIITNLDHIINEAKIVVVPTDEELQIAKEVIKMI